nr:unnamed protein product [Digitaria exilis]
MLSASIETATAVPWADLPPELCNLVVDRLDAFSALRFPAVCRSWAAACQVGPRRLRPGAPTLLTPILMDGNGMAAAAAFALHDVSTGRSFHASVSGRGGLKNRRWVGAKDDWLVTTDATCSLELLNPATGDLVRLPSFATIPGATVEDGLRISVAPSSLLAVAVAATGDERWTPLRNYVGGPMLYEKVFAVDTCGNVYFWDMDDGGANSNPTVVRAPEIQIDMYVRQRFKLATSIGGEVLLVCTYGDSVFGERARSLGVPNAGYRHTRSILLHELDIGGGDSGVWRRVDGIGGDHALFVGQSYPFYVTVPRGSSDLKANSVYAADLNGYVAMVFDQCQGCAGGIGPFVYSDFRGTSLRPIWFRPTAHLDKQAQYVVR